MKKVFRIIAIVSATLLGVYFFGGFLIPSQWKVSESVVISAPKEKIYEQIADLKNWQLWCPWNKERDPSQIYQYEGADSGEGAKWSWISEKHGTGWLEIRKADVAHGVDYHLYLDMNGNVSHLDGQIAFEENEKGVKVLWTDVGDAGNRLFDRWLSLVIKQVIRSEFKNGLNKLKAHVQS